MRSAHRSIHCEQARPSDPAFRIPPFGSHPSDPPTRCKLHPYNLVPPHHFGGGQQLADFSLTRAAAHWHGHTKAIPALLAAPQPEK